MNGGSGTGPAAANSILTFINGIVETGDLFGYAKLQLKLM